MDALPVMKYAFFLICVIFNFYSSLAQDTILEPEEGKQFYILGMDSIPVSSIELDEVIIYPKLKLSHRSDVHEYLILRRKVKRVWPYAVLASQRLDSLNSRLKRIESKRNKRKYTKMIQNYIEEEFSEELKNLTKTEGQILVKLMHRQVGVSTFETVRELRSGWRAFWYNTTASLFSISLKETYKPFEVKEDFYIENILMQAFQNGSLESQKPDEPIDFFELFDHWKANKQRGSLIAPQISD
ncbi:protein of unknown function [Psychroflexus halocasei]|uniref:DUF4294 domain-containing protein n=2 Tax=Psychroflexus halocasei TaxID=908615 RepID=A0A1H3XII3_9FLAO|nr:protein of unknown function [Psychroflexus halocasei]